MLLSIVVPTYNVEDYLGNCLNSLIDQDIPSHSYEIIVINDGSTDKSLSIARQFANKNTNIVIHSQPNKGLSEARNAGIKLAKGKYIYFIDSDDYVAKNTLNYILQLLENYQLDLLGIKVQEVSNLDNNVSINLEAIKNEDIIVTDGITYIANHNYLNNAWWYFINRNFLLESQLFFPVGRFVEDANFTAKLITRAERITSSSLDFYRYYIRPNSIMRKKSAEHGFKMISDYEKNIIEFSEQLDELEQNEHAKIKECLKRLKARQQGFAFFMLVRLMKSSEPVKDILLKLDDLEKIDAYPLNNFLGRDYHGFNYSLLVFIFNHKPMIAPFIRIFRTFYTFVK